MADRASTFSDPEIIKRLQTEFIPAVGNTHEIQNQDNPVQDWFLAMAEKVNPRIKDNVTAQGFYIAGADGKAYGFNNNRTSERVNGFMNDSMKRWAADPPIRVDVPELGRPYGQRPGEGTTVLRMFSRVSPVPAGCHASNNNLGRDHVWVSREELDALADTEADAKGFIKLPASLLSRILRFHLVDNVRGEPGFWEPDEVKQAEFHAIRTQRDNTVKVVFTGDFSMVNQRQGIEGTLSGELQIDRTKPKLIKCLLYAEAEAWGAGQYTPNPPQGKFPMKFAAIMAADDAALNVPPQAGQYAGEYMKPRVPQVITP